MADVNKLNDDVLEDVAGGVLTQEEALASALSHAKLAKGDLDFVKRIEMDFEGCNVPYRKYSQKVIKLYMVHGLPRWRWW